MAKVKMQWKPPKQISKLSLSEQESIRYKSPMDVLTKVYKSEGFLGLFSGLKAQILKAVLCQAFVFVTKENLLRYTNAMILLIYKDSLEMNNKKVA